MNKFAKLALIATLSLTSAASYAEYSLPSPDKSDSGLMLGGWSQHFTEGKYRASHELVAIEYKHVVVGTYINSFNNRSYLAAYNFKYDMKYASFGVMAGINKGYTKTEGRDYKEIIFADKFSPLVLPYVQINTPYVQPRVGLMGRALFLTFNVAL